MAAAPCAAPWAMDDVSRTRQDSPELFQTQAIVAPPAWPLPYLEANLVHYPAGKP